MEYKLYVRGGDCGLCGDAEVILRELGIHFEAVDISPHLPLELEYGKRIPVLREEPGGRELAWPFDIRVVRRFLGEN